METKDVKLHQTTIKACAVQFERLVKTMEKTKQEHGQFRETMRAAMQKADYPTQEMILDLEKELSSFRYTYLPNGSAALQPDDKDLSVEKLDKVVS